MTFRVIVRINDDMTYSESTDSKSGKWFFMRYSFYVFIAVGVLLFFLVRHSPEAKAQTIRSGMITAIADAQGHIHVRLGVNADILNSTLPRQIVHANGEALVNFKRIPGSGDLRAVANELGRGRQLTLRGTALLGDNQKLTRLVQVTAYDQYADLLVFEASYVNTGSSPVTIDSIVAHQYELNSPLDSTSGRPTFWTFQGASYPSRTDWVLPLGADSTHYRGVSPARQLGGTQQENFHRYNYMGMNATDYGGGVPVLDVWTPKGGLAIGHLSPTPERVALPVRMQDKRTVRVQFVEPNAYTIAPGDSLHKLSTFVRYHEGDFYSTLTTYADMMAAQGVDMPTFPETAYEPIWCAWGYGREFETQDILATIPKVKELGLDWVVLDDGWQVAEGDWRPHPERFPNGDASMEAFVDRIHDAGLKAKLWWVPMAADPGSRVDEQHPDWALLNKDGSHREITWWDSYYLCPAVPEVRSYTRDLIDKFINDWGYDGLKVDGQNLNAVPPCYNESHHHIHPTASVRAVPLYFEDVYGVAKKSKSSAVVELCPCGDAASFFNMPFNNQPVASDPTSSWQIRSKGKTFKALMGPRTPYYGDHVELSDGGDDFASSIGIGAVVGTKFTWAPDSLIDQVSWMQKEEPSQLRLTDEREAHWEKWIGLYKEKMLPRGEYRGDLYDIGYDLPEAHAVAKDGVMYYAFYADQWNGPIKIRGLSAGVYEVRDYVNNRSLGTVKGPVGQLNASFTDYLLIEVQPAE